MGLMGYPLAFTFLNIAIKAYRRLPLRPLQFRPTHLLLVAMVPALILGHPASWESSPVFLVAVGTPVIVAGLALVLTSRSQRNAGHGFTRYDFLGYLLAIASSATFSGRDAIIRHVVSGIAPSLVTSAYALTMGSLMLLLLTLPNAIRSFRGVPALYIIMCILTGVTQGVGRHRPVPSPQPRPRHRGQPHPRHQLPLRARHRPLHPQPLGVHHHPSGHRHHPHRRGRSLGGPRRVRLSRSRPLALAILLTFVASIGFASSAVSVRVATQRIPPPTATLFTVLTSIPLGLAPALALHSSEMLGQPLTAYGWFAIMALLAYPIATLSLNVSIKLVGAARSSPFQSAQPIIAFILGTLFLSEAPGLLVAVGTPVIVAGLALVLTSRASRDPSQGFGRIHFFGYLLALTSAARLFLPRHHQPPCRVRHRLTFRDLRLHHDLR